MDNVDQDDSVGPGAFLMSEVNIYMVESFLGYGAYGTVVKCTRVNDRKTVAMKMINNLQCQAAYQEAAKMSISTAIRDKPFYLIHNSLAWNCASTDSQPG